MEDDMFIPPPTKITPIKTIGKLKDVDNKTHPRVAPLKDTVIEAFLPKLSVNVANIIYPINEPK